MKEIWDFFLAMHSMQLTDWNVWAQTMWDQISYVYLQVCTHEQPSLKSVLYQHGVEAFYIIDMQFDCLLLINN